MLESALSSEVFATQGLVIDALPEYRPFRDMVRSFLRANLPEPMRAAALATPTVFADPEIGREWQRILNKKGWLAYNWPVKFGGTGWSPIERYLFERECAIASVPGLPVLGLKLLASVLHVFGTPEQQSHYLPRILSGEHYWCQGFSEAGAGSDLAGLKTRAVRRGSEYQLNGTKIWTTHAQFADHMFCLVRTDASVKPQHGISFLLVDMRQPGVTVRPIRTLAGDHEVNEVFLDNVNVPERDRVGAEGQGWSIAKFLLENERAGYCMAPKLLADIGRLRACAKAEPSGYGGSLLDDASFVEVLGRVELEALGLEMTELRILERVEQGNTPGPQASVVKLVASELRRKIDALAMNVYGYVGLELQTTRPLYGDGAPKVIHTKAAQVAAPRYLNSQAWSIFGGSNEIQRGIIAKSVLMI